MQILSTKKESGQLDPFSLCTFEKIPHSAFSMDENAMKSFLMFVIKKLCFSASNIYRFHIMLRNRVLS